MIQKLSLKVRTLPEIEESPTPKGADGNETPEGVVVGKTEPDRGMGFDAATHVSPSDRRYEAWPRADARPFLRTLKYTAARRVGASLVCLECQHNVRHEGVNNAGDTIMGCKCAVRRLER